jgi:NAD(P)-dependent dehydrogenase (short-subunit alcohol dehydrogenase family)
MNVTEVFLDQLRDGGGDLVNLSSVAGRTARPGNAVYAATKWGINGWPAELVLLVTARRRCPWQAAPGPSRVFRPVAWLRTGWYCLPGQAGAYWY